MFVVLEVLAGFSCVVGCMICDCGLLQPDVIVGLYGGFGGVLVVSFCGEIFT